MNDTQVKHIGEPWNLEAQQVPGARYPDGEWRKATQYRIGKAWNPKEEKDKSYSVAEEIRATYHRIATVHEGSAGEANARRIVACVNALAGIPTEALEGGVVLEALRIAYRHLDGSNPAHKALFEALSQLEGK